MKFIRNTQFINPTVKLKEWAILEYIENKEELTQRELAALIDVAPSMINSYIKNLEEEGYIKREYMSSKSVNYIITAEGQSRRKYLLVSYLKELINMSNLAKEGIETFLHTLKEKGYDKIMIYGAGDMTTTIIETINSAKNGELIKIAAIVDDNPEKQGSEISGYKIISRDEMSGYDHDAVMIASYSAKEEIENKLKEIGYPESKIVRFFEDKF